MKRLPCIPTLLLAAACAGTPAPAADAPPAKVRAASDFSVHDLPTAWKDQSGRSVTLAEVGGGAQVIAMVYTRCTHTCPRIRAELKRLEAALPAGADARFVLVSLDPARDTPARLAEYAADARLDPGRWSLLTGTEDEVREMAALLGLRYRSEDNAEYSHSNSYLVLDGAGRIVHRQSALGEDQAAALAAIGSARGG